MHKKLVKMLLSFIIDILFSEKKTEDNYFNKASCTSLAGKLTICKKIFTYLFTIFFYLETKMGAFFQTLLRYAQAAGGK